MVDQRIIVEANRCYEEYIRVSVRKDFPEQRRVYLDGYAKGLLAGFAFNEFLNKDVVKKIRARKGESHGRRKRK